MRVEMQYEVQVLRGCGPTGVAAIRNRTNLSHRTAYLVRSAAEGYHHFAVQEAVRRPLRCIGNSG